MQAYPFVLFLPLAISQDSLNVLMGVVGLLPVAEPWLSNVVRVID
jgi:hypothetical protein